MLHKMQGICSTIWHTTGFVLYVLCYYLVSIFVTSCVLFHYVCIAVLRTLVDGLPARSQYPEGPATGHLDTGFSWFPCVYKRKMIWFPRLQVATACFSCSSPDLHFLDPYFIFMYTHYNHCHPATAHLQFIIIIVVVKFLTSQLWLGNINLFWVAVISRIRLSGLICSLKSFLQLNMCQELQIFAAVYMYSGTS